MMNLIVLWNKEIEQSNISSPQISSNQSSPHKAHKKRNETSKRVGSNDSENRSSQNNGSIRRSHPARGSDEQNVQNLLDYQNSKHMVQKKSRKDSQETYVQKNDKARQSQNNWDSRVNNAIHSSHLEQSDYNQLEMLMGHTPGSALNNTENLKLCDYLRIVDSRTNSSAPTSNKNKISKSNRNIKNIDDSAKYGANITFESLSAIAKIFSGDFKNKDQSELDFEDERNNDSNLEEVTEEDISDVFEKRKSQPDMSQAQNEKLHNNLLLINAMKSNNEKSSYPEQKAICNSVIIESDKVRSKRKNKHFKKPGLSTLHRKFTVKNKRESDSLLVYNDDYKDNAPKQKRQTMANKARNGGSKRAAKDHRYEGRFSSRKTLKVPNIHKQSHKRSQSLNKSTIEQRYKSVPQNHNYDNEKSKKYHTKKKLNWFFNNKTPQVHVSKTKVDNHKLDLSLKNAKKNLQNYFKDNNASHDYAKKKFESLTGREKGNTLLRKVYLRMENEYPNNKHSYRHIASKRNEPSKKKNGSSKNKIKATNARFISPLFRSERSNSRKVDKYQSPSSMYPKNKCNVSDINKIQTLLTSIRSSRSNKVSKGGTDGFKKSSAYKHDSAYKKTLEPKSNKYKDYSTNIINTINHKDLLDNSSLGNNNFKKNKVLKYFNGGGRLMFEQLWNKLRKYENLKSLYASNETIKSSLNMSSISNSKYGTIKPPIEHKSKTALNNDRIMKKYQKEITMIAKKKRDYMMAQAKNKQKNKFNNLAVKTSQSNNNHNNHNNVNTTASTIMMSLVNNNANNLSITEYPGLNESLVSLNHDFGKMKFGEYVPPQIHYPNKSKKKSGYGRNSTKKFLRDAHTEVRKRHNGSVDKRKPHDYKKSSGSRKKSEEGTKKSKHK